MLSREEHELLTRVGPGAPLGVIRDPARHHVHFPHKSPAMAHGAAAGRRRIAGNG